MRRSSVVSMLRWFPTGAVSRLPMLRLFWPMKLLERWLGEMAEVFFIIFIITVAFMVTMDLVDGLVCCIASFIDNCLGKTLQAVTVLDLFLEVCMSMFINGLLLHPNKIL